MEPLFSGKYPNTMIQNVTNNRLPKFTNDQSKLLMGSYDFLGLNYYVSQYATTAPATNVVSLLTDNKVLEQPVSHANRVTVVFLIGWVDKTDNTKTVEQARVDSERIDYHNKHLQHLQYAIRQVRILRKWRQPDRKYPNEDYSIEMILIDEEMFKYMSKRKMDEHVVVILQFTRVKFFNGNPYVSNSFGSEVSRLFINDEVDDIIKYKKRLMKKTVDDPSSIQLPFGLSMFCSLQDDFLTNTAFTNIGEICEIFEEDDFGKYPSEITHLLEKKFAFKIEVSEFNLKNNYQVYGILKLTDDSTVISELDKRFNIIQVKTFTVDNTTPFSKVKRKLVDIYDLECESSVRDKKLHASDYEENKLDVASKIPLLDPKVEKF
ncbi:hypothetical protein R6Q59_027635 [Mikania micrantha]